MSVFPGVAAGIVREVDAELGRVRLKLPWLPGENETWWARVATMMSGGGRGSWFMPEVGDEVLVAFEMGQIDHPYVIGFLWNERAKPPVKDDAIDEGVRRLRTVKAHRIDFDDRDGKERILLQSHSEHALELSDTSDAFIELRTVGKRLLRLDDKKKAIALHTAGSPKIDLDEQASTITLKTGSSDPAVELTAQSVTIKVGHNSIEVGPAGVTISATGTLSVSVTGSLSVKGSIVSLQSDGPLTLQGSVVSIVSSSVVSVGAGLTHFAGAVVASSIVSPTYSPGVGNLL